VGAERENQLIQKNCFKIQNLFLCDTFSEVTDKAVKIEREV
jgi:hypothetical protein